MLQTGSPFWLLTNTTDTEAHLSDEAIQLIYRKRQKSFSPRDVGVRALLNNEVIPNKQVFSHLGRIQLRENPGDLPILPLLMGTFCLLLILICIVTLYEIASLDEYSSITAFLQYIHIELDKQNTIRN